MRTASEARGLIDRVLTLVRATRGADAVVELRGAREGNTRFAVNEITSSSEIERLSIGLTVQFGLRSASATTNQRDDRSLEELVGRTIRMARLAPENPEQLPPLGAQRYLVSKDPVDLATAQLTPAARAGAVGAAITAADAAKVAIAGFVSHGHHATALGSTAGLVAYHAWTACGMSCTARTPDGTGSGWAGAGSNRMADLDAGALARTAVAKATSSARPRKLDPGRYTVILEPAAVTSLLGFFVQSLGARRADEGRSFFARRRPGEQLFPATITLRSDPTDGALAAAPFDREGTPLAPTRWIDKGKLTALTYPRYWAKHQGKPVTGEPTGWTLEGGAATREALIQGVKRGVLITRLWYLRMLDPQAILVTGLTRDGVYLIEDGAIVHPVNNFRFNDSPVQMLARCDGLGATAIPSGGEGGGSRVPILRSHDFHLASISEAV
jgi:predicted Zn-dependent protease